MEEENGGGGEKTERGGREIETEEGGERAGERGAGEEGSGEEKLVKVASEGNKSTTSFGSPTTTVAIDETTAFLENQKLDRTSSPFPGKTSNMESNENDDDEKSSKINLFCCSLSPLSLLMSGLIILFLILGFILLLIFVILPEGGNKDKDHSLKSGVRPQFHIAANSNQYIGATCAPLYDEKTDTYHLYYQFNPHNSVWGHMQWGKVGFGTG